MSDATKHLKDNNVFDYLPDMFWGELEEDILSAGDQKPNQVVEDYLYEGFRELIEGGELDHLDVIYHMSEDDLLSIRWDDLAEWVMATRLQGVYERWEHTYTSEFEEFDWQPLQPGHDDDDDGDAFGWGIEEAPPWL